MSEGLVHHRNFQGLRPRLGRGGAGARRPRRRHRPRPRDAGRPRRPLRRPVLPIALDVTDKAAVDAAVAQAHEHFGRLDVVVNNAGYGLFGTVEEVSEEQARAQIETNLFGALWVTQAALPILREQGSGHVIQVSSIGGVNAFPTVGLYHASKWGLEGFSQALAQEVAEFGIKVTIVEPTGYAHRLGGPVRRSRPSALAAYDGVRERQRRDARRRWRPGRPRGHRPGDPRARRRRRAAAALLPRRRAVGHDQGRVRQAASTSGRRWNDLSVRAHGGVTA